MSIDYQKILLSATNTNITEYSISEGTTEISPSAFINCNSLTNINMEEPLYLNIGPKAFLTNCKVNNENTLLSAKCSNASFSGKVIIPNDVTSIGSRAFHDCWNLTSVTIPEGVTSIGSSAFDGCSSLKSVMIPEGVTSIGDRAFSLCRSLTSITIPEGVNSIGDEAFSSCSNLKSVTIPNHVTYIGIGTFYNCRGLTSVTIPSSVTSIGARAFWYCTSLTSITIPEGVIFIEDKAFLDCPSLTNIILENRTISETQALIGTINNIGYTGTVTCKDGTYRTEFYVYEGGCDIDCCFAGCTNEEYCCGDYGCGDYCCSGKSINYYPEYETIAVYSDGSEERFTIIGELNSNNVPSGASELRVGSGVTTIATHTFANDASINILRLPGTVYGLHQQAFSYATNLSIIDCTNMDYPPTLDEDRNVFNGTSAKIIVKDGTYDNWINSPIGYWINNSQFIELIEASNFYN